jgi:FO synthase
MTAADLALLRVSVSMGLMLESASERLCQRGSAHFRLAGQAAGAAPGHARGRRRARDPVTTRTPHRHRRERAPGATVPLALRETLHARHGHLQELIIQNSRQARHAHGARSGPRSREQLWTLAVARA